MAPSLHPVSLRKNVKPLLLGHTGIIPSPPTEECYYRKSVENIIPDTPCVIPRMHYWWRFLSTINRSLPLNKWFNLTDVWTVCIDCFPVLLIASKFTGKYGDHSPRIFQYMSCIFISTPSFTFLYLHFYLYLYLLPIFTFTFVYTFIFSVVFSLISYFQVLYTTMLILLGGRMILWK